MEHCYLTIRKYIFNDIYLNAKLFWFLDFVPINITHAKSALFGRLDVINNSQ